MADFPGVIQWARMLLEKDEDELSDDDIDLYAGAIFRRLQDTYTLLGDYGDLSLRDTSYMDEGIGHLAAVRIRPKSGKTAAVGDVKRVHSEDVHFEFEPQTLYRKALEQQWLDAARDALGQVTVIKAVVSERASKFSMVAPSGARRNAMQAKPLDGLAQVMRSLAEDFLALGDGQGWTHLE